MKNKTQALSRRSKTGGCLRCGSKGQTRLAAWALLLTSTWRGDATAIKDHSRFCVRHGAEWEMQAYAPLIDTRNGTEFVQATYTGTWLQRVLAKKYDSRVEVMYEYKFTEDGKLLALHGKLRRWGRWMAEADLFPELDGSLPNLEVKYRLSQDGGVIQAPDDGSSYTRIFSSARVYRETAEIPCAALFKEAERKDATQK